jgi:Ca2+-binding RTX toxin-like protein
MSLFSNIKPTDFVWVSANAKLPGDGSAERPFSTIQAAVTAAKPGTAIMVQAGTYVENIKFPSNAGGTPDAPIWLVSADGPQAAHIVAKDARLSTIQGLGVDNVVVQNFSIEGGKNGIQFSLSGTDFANTVRNIVVQGNTITKSLEDGVKISQGINVHVLDNRIVGAGDQGVDFVAVNQSVIARNEVIGTKGVAGIFAKGGSTDVLIADNFVKGSGMDGITAGGWTTKKFMWPGINYEARNVTITGNVVEDVPLRAVSVLGAQNTVVSKNVLEASPSYFTTINIGAGNPKHSPPPVSSSTTIVDNVITRATGQVYAEPGNRSGLVVSGNKVGALPSTLDVTHEVDIPRPVITGTDERDTLTGTAASERIDGKAGADVMRGGKGHDVYVVDDARDEVVERASEGVDTIELHNSFMRLGANIENLVLQVNADATLMGNSLDNMIVGGAGHDVIVGDRGADTLTGGAGQDRFFVDRGHGHDTITDFRVGEDQIALRDLNIDSFAQLQRMMRQDGADTVVTLGDGQSLRLQGVDMTALTANDFGLGAPEAGLRLMASEAMASGRAATRIVGVVGNDSIVGTERNDHMDARSGIDLMAGGRGDDTYVISSRFDRVLERAGEGVDTVIVYDTAFALDAYVENLRVATSASANVAGNDLANIMQGGRGADTIAGLGGRDVLSGGAGADRFVFHDLGDAGDRILDFRVGEDRLDLSALRQSSPNVQFELVAQRGAVDIMAHAGDVSTLLVTLNGVQGTGLRLADLVV